MDRDAAPLPASPADAVPPHPPATVRLVGLVGVGLCALAAVLALVGEAFGESQPAALNAARLFLSFIGIVTAGAAVSMRPDLWWAWGLGSVAASVAVVGLPADWDSFHLLFRALAGVAAIGAALCAAPRGVRVFAGSAALLFHFSGIFMAATSPPARPWLNEELYTRFYDSYLRFIYMRNAYQFYSPEPGPASLLAFFLKTETGTDPDTGKKQYKTQWVVIPRRPADVRDPLGLSYYRRLSLTEQVARGSMGLGTTTDQFEKSEIRIRRISRSIIDPDRPERVAIPFHPIEDPQRQYILPNPDVTRFVLPSYASHIILEHTTDKAAAGKTTVKVYRLEHRTLAAEEFIPVGEYKMRLPPGVKPSPYAPPTYRPFFVGEFDALGNLIDPQEDCLYWMIPVIPRLPGPDDPIKKSYIDFLSAHALDMKPEDVLKADESQGTVFNWSLLK